MAGAASALIWSTYFQLSYNAYADQTADDRSAAGDLVYAPAIRWDHRLWEDLVSRVVEAGGNQIVLSLGDGIRYDSHPEIAVEGAWTPAELKREIERLSELGIELVPELNFSTTHDVWLGPYHRMISTPAYYTVCADLIAEVIDIFDRPRFFHIGFDEETWELQQGFSYVVLRQHDLWWHDLLWLIDQVESRGSRAWIWSDAIWNQTGRFLERMPRSVIQSNWYYGDTFDLDAERANLAAQGVDLTLPGESRTKTGELAAFLDLAAGQFEQIPTGSSFEHAGNFPALVQFVRDHLPPERVLGFMQTTWRPMLETYRDELELGVEMFAAGKRAYEEERSQ